MSSFVAHGFVVISYNDPPGCSSRSVGQQDLLKWFARISWEELSGAISSIARWGGSRITNFDRLEMIDWKKTCHHVAKMFEEYKFLEAPIDNSSQYSILYPYALETSQRTETITKRGQLSPQFQVGKGRPFITQRLFFSAPPKKCLKVKRYLYKSQVQSKKFSNSVS